jgi:superfamily II DNA or RNA helicase
MIGGGKFRIGDRLTVALVQSLYGRAAEVAEHIGHLVIDEVHHAPSRTFTEAVSAFDSWYMLGLSATPYRRDGMTQMIGWYVGPIVHRIDQGVLVQQGSLVKAQVIPVETNFWTRTDASEYYSKVLSELVKDEGRNRLIVDVIRHEIGKTEGVLLALSDRKYHCKAIRDMLYQKNIEADILTGDMSSSKRKEIVEQMRAGKIRVVVGTSALLGEGLDVAGIETLLITCPIKFTGRLIQHIGRALRPAPGKTTVRIIDFVDAKVGVLEAAANSRMRTYQRMPGVRLMAMMDDVW